MTDLTCDNCGNNIEVRFDDVHMAYWCMPCREAQLIGDIAYFNMRREYLLGKDPL